MSSVQMKLRNPSEVARDVKRQLKRELVDHIEGRKTSATARAMLSGLADTIDEDHREIKDRVRFFLNGKRNDKEVKEFLLRSVETLEEGKG